MNLRQLKYAIETARAGSITQAAQNLYMAQPNLSNALKELEASIGIKIFRRSSHGVEVTSEGREFLDYAESIVDQVEDLERQYQSQGKHMVRLRIGSVNSSNVSHITAEFVRSIPADSPMQVDYRETNPFDLLHLIETGEVDLGMISFPLQHKPYFSFLMESKSITAQPIRERPVYLLMSAEHPLANEEHIEISMLNGYTEVIYGSLDSPGMQYDKWMAEAGITLPHRLVAVYDRASMTSILSSCHDCYKWTNATHPAILKAYNLVARRCETDMMICEMAVYSKNRPLNRTQRQFLKRLQEMADYPEFQ